VFDLLDDAAQTVDINWWRPGGTAWFTTAAAPSGGTCHRLVGLMPAH
jgi:hypothetical protein